MNVLKDLLSGLDERLTQGPSSTPMGIPEHLRDGLEDYIKNRVETGGFLRAALENDLREALGRSDEISRFALFDIVSFLYNAAPSNCWGSPEKVAAWLGERR